MNILIFAPYYYPHVGGLENYVKDLSERLIKAGDEVTVVTTNIPESAKTEFFEGVEIVRIPAFEIIHNYPLLNIFSPNFWTVWKSIFKTDYSVVFSNTRFFLTSLMAWRAARKMKVKYIHIEHGAGFVESGGYLIRFIAWVVDGTLGKFILRHSDENIAVSRKAADFINRFDKRESTVIYRGIDENLKNIARQEPDDKVRLAYVGRLIDGKGVLDLVKALAKLKHKNFKCNIIGEGPEKEKIVKEVDRFGLKENISIIGQKEHGEVINLLRTNDIFINPSYTEGLPTSVLEAVCCGNLVVATDVGGTSEILEKYPLKIMTKPKDVGSLAKALEQAIDQVERKANILKKPATDYLKDFDWSRSISQIKTVIKQ